MKTIYLFKTFLFVIFAFILTISCSENDDPKPVEETDPEELKAEYNNSNYGLYKGVIIGSSGTIRLFIAQDYVRAYLDFENIKDTLTTANTFSDKQAILNAIFTGDHSTMKFSVDADGLNPTLVDITIEGHDEVTGIIAKETTTQEVRCFEGTFSGDDLGTFNCIIFGQSIVGVFKSTQNGPSGQVNGTASGDTLSAESEGSTSSGASFEGTITENTCSGTWFSSTEYINDEGDLVVLRSSGSWQGTRTL